MKAFVVCSISTQNVIFSLFGMKLTGNNVIS
jgi:hypothetical protein